MVIFLSSCCIIEILLGQITDFTTLNYNRLNDPQQRIEFNFPSQRSIELIRTVSNCFKGSDLSVL